MLPFDARLCLITDRSFCSSDDFFRILEISIDAGVTWVQFREKSGPNDRDIFELGKKVRALTARKGVPMIVNDRLDLAMALEADGIHLGQGDLPLEVAKKLWRPNKIYGLSVQTLEHAERARHDGADYLGLGSLFPTSSKNDAIMVHHQQIELIKMIGIPLIGIGGITPERIKEIRNLNLSGVAVISAIWGAPDPSAVVKQFIQQWNSLITC
ncbi:thiamine phosphate synthase [Gracilinema caldarium]|uniref:Thiamine-phosphate synthase n=1 Tax=Gracilinema caldarium (strain ATCC 51460 / DSM 7334 / H1) TaxID=744872 RepID=F8EWV4_GRAC1|nr:thiamine phosphate synthase [Gracilinema caldarium]AEJ18340.1 Thiamine-phosphate pyrophosphorylase [Gracilinema caldarium DSM 7334]